MDGTHQLLHVHDLFDVRHTHLLEVPDFDDVEALQLLLAQACNVHVPVPCLFHAHICVLRFFVSGLNLVRLRLFGSFNIPITKEKEGSAMCVQGGAEGGAGDARAAKLVPAFPPRAWPAPTNPNPVRFAHTVWGASKQETEDPTLCTFQHQPKG